jgi:RNA polymerase sigma-70 factor (ECF subfamily)
MTMTPADDRPVTETATEAAATAATVQRARRGDFDAFEVLYREHVGRIYALCLRLTGDPARAEEATQDAFVRAWRKLDQFRGDSRFSSWLYRLASNVVFMGHRSRRRREARIRPVADLRLVEDAPTALRSEGPAEGTALDLERAIADLPEQGRRVFVLHDVEGHRHEEIARMLGIAVGTSKSQLHRARRSLRRTLGGES